MNGKKSRQKNILLCVASVVILCLLLFPLYWILVTSLKTEQEIFQIPPTWFPQVFNTSSYAAQLETGDFNMFRSFGNSFVIAFFAMIIAVVLAVISLLFMAPVFAEYLATGLVPRFPTLIVCGFVMVAALMLFVAGVILSSLLAKDKRDFEFHLQQAAVWKAKARRR